jgi:hypothetical protein
VEIFAPGAVIDDQEYFITFSNDTDSLNYITTDGLSVYKVFNPLIDLGCVSESCVDFSGENECNDSGCNWSEIQFSGGMFEDISDSGVVSPLSLLFHFLNGESDSLTINGEWTFPGLVNLTFLNDNSCSKAIFQFSFGSLIEIGTWNSSHIEYIDNTDCIPGTGEINGEIQFELTISEDSTFTFSGDPFFDDYLVQSSCTNNRDCEELDNEQDCETTPMCSWEKQYTSLVYDEKPLEGWVNDFPGENLIQESIVTPPDTIIYWTFNPNKEIMTDVFEGVNIRINIDTARVVDEEG